MVSQHRKYISSLLFLVRKTTGTRLRRLIHNSHLKMFEDRAVGESRCHDQNLTTNQRVPQVSLKRLSPFTLSKPALQLRLYRKHKTFVKMFLAIVGWGRFPSMVSSLRGVCYHAVLRCALWRDGLWQDTYNVESAVCRDHARKNINHGDMSSFHLHVKKQNRYLSGGC